MSLSVNNFTPEGDRGLKLEHYKLQCFYYAYGEFQEDPIRIPNFFFGGGVALFATLTMKIQMMCFIEFWVVICRLRAQ